MSGSEHGGMRKMEMLLLPLPVGRKNLFFRLSIQEESISSFTPKQIFPSKQQMCLRRNANHSITPNLH